MAAKKTRSPAKQTKPPRTRKQTSPSTKAAAAKKRSAAAKKAAATKKRSAAAKKAAPKKKRSTAAKKAAPRTQSLRLHRTIYPAQAVKDAAQAFAELAEITVRRQGDYHRVSLRPRGDTPPEQLKHEFANYALSRAARNR